MRCQDCKSDEFKPCYASVLVLDKDEIMEDRIRKIEEKIWPMFTAWCSQCRKPCMITKQMHLYPCNSAFYVHQIVELNKLVQYDLMD